MVYQCNIKRARSIAELRLFITPLGDIVVFIWLRSLASSRAVEDDREHLHHLLLERGYRAEQIVSSEFLLSLILGALVVFFYHIGVSKSLFYVAFMSVCVVTSVATNRPSQKT